MICVIFNKYVNRLLTFLIEIYLLKTIEQFILMTVGYKPGTLRQRDHQQHQRWSGLGFTFLGKWKVSRASRGLPDILYYKYLEVLFG